MVVFKTLRRAPTDLGSLLARAWGRRAGRALLPAAAVALGLALFAAPSPTSSRPASTTLAGAWRDANPPLVRDAAEPGTRPPALSDTGPVLAACPLPLDGETFTHTSDIKAAPHPFNAVGFRWTGSIPGSARLDIEARTSEDGDTWGEWLQAEEVDALRGADAHDTDLLFSSGRYLQYRVSVLDVPPGWEPELREITITYINSTEGPSAADISAEGGPLARLAALARPAVFSRSSWGANERYRTWPPKYATTRKIIIHHTATSNDPPDPTAAVRAIYYYHAVTLAWGDIGYNFLIDAAGRVYEGRYGGPNVIGAHALQFNSGSIGVALLGNFVAANPAGAAQRSLSNLILAKAVEHGINPKGSGVFQGVNLPNVVGHRDVINTSCPGDRLYATIPALRDQTAAALPPLGEAWMGDRTPRMAAPAEEIAASVTVQNSGTATWSDSGSSAFRLGFRWLKSDGSLYDAEALEGQVDLPLAVVPGQSVTLQPRVRTPSLGGRYVLRWDMLQRPGTWFVEQGNQPLEREVFVVSWAITPNDVLVALPNELLVLAPVERLRTLPLSRLTLLANDDLVQLLPDILPMFPNQRVLSFSNDLLLKYLPDDRLKTFSLDRIRTFPAHVQERLGFPPPSPAPAPAPAPAATSTPVTVPSPTATGAPSPSPIATPAAPSSATANPTDPGGAVAP